MMVKHCSFFYPTKQNPAFCNLKHWLNVSFYLHSCHIFWENLTFLFWQWQIFNNTQCNQFFTSKIAKLCQKNGLWKRLTCAVDYVEIISEDPRITTLHASKFHTMFLHNELPEFDAIISYSSLEHSGLGRYRNIF